MITFETQEDFENAVMKVLKDRLLLEVSRERYTDGIVYTLSDKDYSEIVSYTVYL